MNMVVEAHLDFSLINWDIYKTTTLSHMSSSQVNVCTIENTISFNLSGVFLPVERHLSKSTGKCDYTPYQKKLQLKEQHFFLSAYNENFVNNVTYISSTASIVYVIA